MLVWFDRFILAQLQISFSFVLIIVLTSSIHPSSTPAFSCTQGYRAVCWILSSRPQGRGKVTPQISLLTSSILYINCTQSEQRKSGNLTSHIHLPRHEVKGPIARYQITCTNTGCNSAGQLRGVRTDFLSQPGSSTVASEEENSTTHITSSKNRATELSPNVFRQTL